MYALVMLQSFFSGLGDRLTRDEEGATAVEYGLMVALIAVAIITAVALVGENLTNLFNNVANELPATPAP